MTAATSNYNRNLNHAEDLQVGPLEDQRRRLEERESDPISRHFCLTNQYLENPQMYALLRIIMDVYEEDQMSLTDLSEILDSVEFGYKHFHGLTPSPVDWSKVESSRLLWGDVKIDGAYQKHAEGHIRVTVKLWREYRMKLAQQAKKTV